MHAENADLADKRVAHHLKDTGNHGLVRIGCNMHGVTLCVHKGRGIGFHRCGHMADDDLDEVADTDQVFGACEAHRDDVAFAEGLGDRGVQRTRIGVAFFEVLFHRGVVDFHHALNKGAVHVRDRHDVAFACVAVKAVDDAGHALGGKVNGKHAVTERFFEFAKKLRQIHTLGINLIDHNHAAVAAAARPLHHAAGHEFNALGGINHHDDVFNGIKR